MTEKTRPEDQGYKNPPLHQLNTVTREDDETRRGERNEVVEQITGALGQWASPRGKRMQKNLRAPV